MTAGPPLIVTRPEPGNAATVRRARAMGFAVHAMPLFAAHPVDDPAVLWDLDTPADYEKLIKTQPGWA